MGETLETENLRGRIEEKDNNITIVFYKSKNKNMLCFKPNIFSYLKFRITLRFTYYLLNDTKIVIILYTVK